MKSKSLICVMAGVLLLCLCIGVVSAVGVIDWQKALGGSGADIPFSVQQTSDGGYILTGYTESSSSGDVGVNHGDRDVWVVKTDAAGSLQWQRVLGNSMSQESYRIKQTSDSGYILTGTTDGWATEDVGFGGWGGTQGSTSMVFDASGNPHISYCDSNATTVVHAWQSGGVWSTEIVESGVSGYGQYTSLAYDGIGTLHMSYMNGGLKHAWKDGTGWHTEPVDMGFNVGGSSSLKIDGYGNPAISYFSYPGSSGQLNYAYLSGSMWVIDNVNLVSSSSGYTSLAFDSSGYPWISYTVDAATLYPALWLAHKDISGWHMESVDVGDGYQRTSLAFDSSGILHVTYVSDTWTLKHAWRTGPGPTWTIETVDTGGVSSSSLAFDASGNPHVGYGTDGGLKHAVKHLGSWTIEAVDPTASGWYTSIAFDPDGNPHGNPHISYFDMNIPSGGLTYGAIKHAWWMNNRFESDVLVVKLNSGGAIEWQKALGGNNWEDGYDITQTSDGGYALLGRTTSSNSGNVQSTNHGGIDFWLVKLSSSGTIVWERALGGSDLDEGFGIQQTSDGGYILAGSTKSTDLPESNHGGFDIRVVKVNSAGMIEWSKCLGGSGDDYTWRIYQTSDGGYITAGWTDSSGTGDVGLNHGGLYDAWVVKLDSAGTIVWQKVLGGNGFDIAKDVKQTSDGGYIIAASTTSDNSGDVGPNHSSDWDTWVVKLDSSGTIEWQNLLGGNFAEEGESIALTSDQGYIVTGLAFSNSNGDVGPTKGGTDFWLVKLKDQAPTVTSITPNFGVVDTGSVAITDLAGTDFVSGATVKLTKAGIDISATNIVTTSTKITCEFDLTGAETGSWDVVVTNPDSQTGTLTDGFAVMPTDRDGAVAHGVDKYLDDNEEGNGKQWLQASDTVVPPSTTITFLDGSEIVTPGVPVWVVFVDEDKQASYGHPCKLDLYFDDTNYIEYDVQFPPTEVNGVPIALSYGAGKAPNAIGLTSTEPPYITDPNCVPNPANNYAVLISGGGTSSTNYARYYNDIKFLYNTLVNDYKYPRDHIRVVMSDGTSDTADQVIYTNNVASTINSEQNLDNVPTNHAADDVNYAATKTNVQTALNFWGPLSSSANLLIFTTGHGEKVTDPGGDPNSNDVNLLLWGSGVKVTDTEFVSYLPANPKITLVMEQCYGGGIKDEYIVSSVSNRVLETAAKGNEASHNNDFSYFWITAVSGHDSAIPTPNPANADTSNNAQVSAYEAYYYANQRDPSGPRGAQTENPVYSSYVSGGGDSQYLSACTNPYSITPNTPGTWTYTAANSNPVTVTWTRDGFVSPYPNVKVELWKGSGTSALLQKTIASQKAVNLGTTGTWYITSPLPGGPGPGYWIKISTIGGFSSPPIVGTSSGTFTINGVTASGIGNPTITSSPTDALVEITDSAGQPVYIGGVLQTGKKTPALFTGIAAGTYNVRLSKSCYWPSPVIPITVAGGGSSATFGPYTLNAMPTTGNPPVCVNDAAWGNIAIESVPKGGYYVSMDNVPMGYGTPVLETIGVGSHEVRLDMPGYIPQTKTVIVKAGELTIVIFEMVEDPNWYTFTGFDSPVDMNGVINTVNAGRNIPLKWHLSDKNGGYVSDPEKFKVQIDTLAGCSGTLDEIEVLDTTTVSSVLTYQGNGAWHYNWKTNKADKGCRKVYLEYTSNGLISTPAFFRFK